MKIKEILDLDPLIYYTLPNHDQSLAFRTSNTIEITLLHSSKPSEQSQAIPRDFNTEIATQRIADSTSQPLIFFFYNPQTRLDYP
jgi:hypothetical protein